MILNGMPAEIVEIDKQFQAMEPLSSGFFSLGFFDDDVSKDCGVRAAFHPAE